MTNNPDQFASGLHTELLRTARFVLKDKESSREVKATDDATADGAASLPPPPPPSVPPSGVQPGGTTAGASASAEQEQPAVAVTSHAIDDEKAVDETESVDKQRRVRVMPPPDFACLVAHEIRSQIQAHLHATLRSASMKKGGTAPPTPKTKHPPLPITAGGPSNRATLQQQGQHRSQLHHKPPLRTVRICSIGTAHRLLCCCNVYLWLLRF